MKFDIKKTFIDPLIDKKIGIPSVKNIVLLKSADKYDEFQDLVSEQRDNMFEKPWTRIVPGLVMAAVSIGTSLVGYISIRKRNDELHDEAELMLNEALADIELFKKESK